MSRQPVYHPDHKTLRIISAPNGRWQAQRRGAGKVGRENDPWLNLGPATAYEQAEARMNSAARHVVRAQAA